MIHEIIQEINSSNSSNHKLAVLRKYADNKMLKQVLKMTYDKVAFTYGATMEQVTKFEPVQVDLPINLGFVLDSITADIASRGITGHKALQRLSNLIGNLRDERDRDIVRKVINRDQRINVGRTQINKVWKSLITKPVYMRCGVYSEKTAKKIKFPAVIQLKADGTYREFSVLGGVVESRSRSGESYEYPYIFEILSNCADGVYVGELTVRGIEDRAKGNGLINSDNPPHEDIILEAWDFVTHDEYNNAVARVKNKIPYKARFFKLISMLENINSPLINTIPFADVSNITEALKITSDWMRRGFEGSVLKDSGGLFKDGTSAEQLKLKIKIEVEMRITGFKDGTKGTKREGKVGSIHFSNDEGTIKGSSSGFSDAQMEEFTENPENFIGKIAMFGCNDLTKSVSNDFYALSHPRYEEIRDDKDETDTLERVLELRDMALELS